MWAFLTCGRLFSPYEGYFFTIWGALIFLMGSFFLAPIELSHLDFHRRGQHNVTMTFVRAERTDSVAAL